jgi:hypothetical protein
MMLRSRMSYRWSSPRLIVPGLPWCGDTQLSWSANRILGRQSRLSPML